MAKQYTNLGVTIIDATADLPASPVEGLIVYQKDTNEIKIYDGSAWKSVIDTDTPPGLVLITSTSYSGATSANFNNVFNSGFRNYKVMIDPVTLSANNTGSYFYLRLRASGTDSSAANYIYNNYGWSASGSASPTGIGWGEYLGNTFTLGHNYYGGFTMSLDFYRPYVADSTVITGTGMTNNAAIPYSSTFSGTHTAATIYDGFTIYPSSAVNISGTIRVYGYRDS